MNPELDAFTNALLVIAIAFFAVVILVGLTIKISEFNRELDYLKREIARTEGAEREYWKREKGRTKPLMACDRRASKGRISEEKTVESAPLTAFEFCSSFSRLAKKDASVADVWWIQANMSPVNCSGSMFADDSIAFVSPSPVVRAFKKARPTTVPRTLAMSSVTNPWRNGFDLIIVRHF